MDDVTKSLLLNHSSNIILLNHNYPFGVEYLFTAVVALMAAFDERMPPYFGDYGCSFKLPFSADGALYSRDVFCHVPCAPLIITAASIAAS